MNDRERYEELIPAYLDGRLSTDDRQRLEAAIRDDAELRQEVAEQRRLLVGLDLLDKVRGKHIDSELLALYAEDSPDLDDAERSAVEAHLKECPECREELDLCVQVVHLPERQVITERPSWVQQIVDALFPTSFAVRPVLVYTAVVLLVFGAYYISNLDQPALTASARFELNSVAVRGGPDESVLTLEPGLQVIVLDLILPTEEGRSYDLTLADSKGVPLLTYHAIPHALPLTIEIPAEAVSPGAYVLWAVESAGPDAASVSQDTTRVRFSIRHAP